MATSFIFKFYICGYAKAVISMNTADAESDPYETVCATTYPKAVKIVLALKLPSVTTEKDLQFYSAEDEGVDRAGEVSGESA